VPSELDLRAGVIGDGLSHIERGIPDIRKSLFQLRPLRI